MRASERSQRLVGEGVELRRHDRANYQLYARWYGDEEIWRLTSWAKEPLRRSEVERLFENREKSSADDSFAIHREGDNEPIGVVSLVKVSKSDASAELSVIVGDERDRNEGLGTEAIRIILRYAFEDLGLEQVSLSVFEFNEPAIHAYEKLGFEREGRIQRAVRRDGTPHDAILMKVRAPQRREGAAPY
jgi:RimJ/RimL family protein N-acetyltransferase